MAMVLANISYQDAKSKFDNKSDMMSLLNEQLAENKNIAYYKNNEAKQKYLNDAYKTVKEQISRDTE